MQTVKIKREAYIDSLKGIAILGIIAVHSGMGHQSEPLSSFGKFGANAVQLFFILSTYLACVSLSKYPVRNFRDYLKWIGKKWLRIAPLYYLALVIAMIETNGLGNPYWAGNAPISIVNIVSHILFINGFNPYWINSIMSVEWYIADLMILYIILPWILKAINSYEQAGFLVIFTICLAFSFNHGVDKIFMASENEILRTYVYNFSFVNQFQVMAFGILLFYTMPYIQKNIGKRAGYLILFTGIYILIGVIFNRTLKVTSIYGYIAIGFTLMVIGSERSRCKIFNNPILAILGKYSYGIYLIHYTIIDYCYSKNWIVNGCSLRIYIVKYLCIVLISLCIAIICQNIIQYLEKTVYDRCDYGKKR